MNPAKIFSSISPALGDVARVLESVHAQLELINEKLDKVVEHNELQANLSHNHKYQFVDSDNNVLKMVRMERSSSNDAGNGDDGVSNDEQQSSSKVCSKDDRT